MLLNPQSFISEGQLLYALIIDVPKECGLPDVYKTCYLNSWALSLTWFTIDIVSSSCCFNSELPFPSALSLTTQGFTSSRKAPLTSSLPSIVRDKPCPYYKETHVDSTRSRDQATSFVPSRVPSQS